MGPEHKLLPWPQIPANPQLCEELKQRRPVGGGGPATWEVLVGQSEQLWASPLLLWDPALGASGTPRVPAHRSDPGQLPAVEPLPAQKCPLNKRTRLFREAFFQPSISEALRPQPGGPRRPEPGDNEVCSCVTSQTSKGWELRNGLD